MCSLATIAEKLVLIFKYSNDKWVHNILFKNGSFQTIVGLNIADIVIKTF